MSHMVIYQSGDGQPVYHEASSLEDAVRHVEQLRNVSQGSDHRIFVMNEVKIEVKTYYRVEIATPAQPEKVAPPAAPSTPPPGPSASAAAPAAPVSPPPGPPAAPADGKGEAVGAGAGGRFGLFGKP